MLFSLRPDSSFHGIEGAKHMPTALVPKIYDPSLADQNLEIATEDAYAMARQLSRGSGLLVGSSAAAAVVGCLKIAERPSVEARAESGDGDHSVRLRRKIFKRKILERRDELLIVVQMCGSQS